ncbi:hypothetical protein AB0911_37470 [Streptomyces nigra]|uniref:hypothetical protein n=1 Tax=Streptomyces nigra TaxID=1827580 RepID=UPI003456DCEF
MAVRTGHIYWAREATFGWGDEFRSSAPIPPQGIVGVATSDRTLNCRLSELEPKFDSMSPYRCLDYQQRNIEWIAQVCGQSVASELAGELQIYRQKSENGSTLSNTESAEMQKSILGKYVTHLRQKTWQEPTVRDAINDVMHRTGRVVVVLPWGDRDRKELQDRVHGMQNERARRFGKLRTSTAAYMAPVTFSSRTFTGTDTSVEYVRRSLSFLSRRQGKPPRP